ncbi:DUF5624 domain-containing protein [Ensifer canadensis]
MPYRPDPRFVDLYELYTGPRSIAAELSQRKMDATADTPLLISTGSDLVLFPGRGREPVSVSFRLSTRGFKELTAVSHLGTAAAWVVEMQEAGMDGWQLWARRFIAQCEEVRAASTVSYWASEVTVEAWKGWEPKIVDVVDYACRTAESYLQAGLQDPSVFTYEQLRQRFLEPPKPGILPVAFNDVMVATFALTFLDIAHRMLTWLKSLELDWQTVMVMICGSSGRPTAGLTWATNNMCHMVWRASQRALKPEHLLISPHAPGLNLEMIKSGSDLRDLEKSYRTLWCKTRVTAEIGGRMFEGFPVFAPDIGQAPIIADPSQALSEMPRLQHPNDRFTAISRLRLVMEDPRQLLSNSVAEFIIDELSDNGLDPASVTIPCFTNTVYPAAQRAEAVAPECPTVGGLV